MGIIRSCLGVVLSRLANLEFDALEGRGSGRLRKWHLRIMRVRFGQSVRFGRDVYIRHSGGLQIGDRCAIGSFTKVWNYHPVTIGDDFMGSGGLVLNTATHDPETLECHGGPIRIGNRVWCGLNVTILSGVTIGDDVVIGAGSVVTKDVPSKCVVAGVPARRIRDLSRPAGGYIVSWTGERRTIA